ncbi:SGNH/GDSL hydrolase family protein [Shewanella sp.]|uniref:SGNH/GDSL hydrolase family protein n=1 Tax=Shewanella sp. TaxID=50422 RepID=UPI0040543EBB
MLDQGISIMLAPLLLIQGLHVHRKTPRLAEPKGERMGQTGASPTLSVLILGDSAAAGVGVLHQQQALLGQVVEQLAPLGDLSFNLFAKTGATTASTLQTFEKNIHSSHPILSQPHFDVIITSLGVNDVTSPIRCDKWLEQQTQLIMLLTQRYSPKHILLTAVPPLGLFPALPNPLRWSLGKKAQRFNRQLQLQVDRFNGTTNNTQFSLIHLPLEKPEQHSSMLAFMAQVMATDGFHPGAQIYTAWAKRIAEEIKFTHLAE